MLFHILQYMDIQEWWTLILISIEICARRVVDFFFGGVGTLTQRPLNFSDLWQGTSQSQAFCWLHGRLQHLANDVP